jgi:hypothetical protein
LAPSRGGWVSRSNASVKQLNAVEFTLVEESLYENVKFSLKLEQSERSAETWQSQFTHKSNTVTQTRSVGRYEPLN